MSRSKAGAIAHIRDLLGRGKIADLTPSAFIDFARERETEGAGPATIMTDLSYIGTVLQSGSPLAGIATAEQTTTRSGYGLRRRKPCARWRRHQRQAPPWIARPNHRRRGRSKRTKARQELQDRAATIAAL
jgi:hypothetical protein